MRISDWSSDVCSSDLHPAMGCRHPGHPDLLAAGVAVSLGAKKKGVPPPRAPLEVHRENSDVSQTGRSTDTDTFTYSTRSEEHTSELQSLMRISYAVFCLKKKTK